MITTSQFQERLIQYLDGELPEAERREVEEYLQAHPETSGLKGDLALLSEAGRSIRESRYPADLLLDANRALAARLAGRSDDVGPVREAAPVLSGNGSPRVPGPTSAPHGRRWRPRALAAALAAAAVLAGAASQRAAIAEIAGSLLQRIRVSLDGKPAEVIITGLPGEVTEVLSTTALPSELRQMMLETTGLPREELETANVIILETKGGEADDDGPRIIEVTINVPTGGDTISVPLSRSGPSPAGKMGASSPGVPARSWGEVKEAVESDVEGSR